VIDVLILNRNLGEICDSLVRDLESRLGSDDTITVIDAGSMDGQQSSYTAVKADDSDTRDHGLRFGRGMNLGLKHRAQNGLCNPWVLMLPVDTEVVFWDVERLIEQASAVNELVAIKPVESESPYAQLLGQASLKLAWNLEEGPWLIRSSFIKEQQKMSARGEFFSHDNFRGYLTSLDLAFRAYANGYCLGISNNLVLHENESYLLNRSDLIGTEPLDLNRKLLVSEGLDWLRGSYAIEDPWSFAQVVRLLYARFLEENPKYQTMGIEAIHDEN
jgi:hypothetical protein